MSERSIEEKRALEIYRYKAWIAELTRADGEFSALKERMNYCLLEAREQVARMLELGMSRQEIEAHGRLPEVKI